MHITSSQNALKYLLFSGHPQTDTDIKFKVIEEKQHIVALEKLKLESVLFALTE